MQDHNQAFIIMGQPVYWYGVIIALGAALAGLCAWSREKRLGLPKETTLDLALIVIPLGLIMARLYYVAFSWDQYRDDLIYILNPRHGGMAIYGGLIGGALGGAIYSRWKRIPFLHLADLVAPALALAQGIGRWGNYMNQEAYGITVTNPAMQWFPMAVFIDATGAWHYATFFYESLWCVLIAAALFVIERRGGIKRMGDGFFLYVLLYMAERTVVEGLRTDSLYLGAIRVSQWLSIVGMAAIALVFARRHLHLGARPGGLIHGALVIALAVGAMCCAALDVRAWPYLLALVAASLCHALWMYIRLPNAHPYDNR